MSTKDAWPHFRSNFLYFHTVSAKILPNNRVSAKSQRLSPPPGNPGSATVNHCFLFKNGIEFKICSTCYASTF